MLCQNCTFALSWNHPFSWPFVAFSSLDERPLSFQVKSEWTKKHNGVSIEALEVDLCSSDSIFSFKGAVEASLQSAQPARQLQLLVNNAGILACSQRWTDDGFDR